jgi:hypothetical protein
MAEQDVEILINKKEEFQLKKEKLQKIIDICDQEFSYSDYDFYSISNKAKLIIYAMNMELEEIKKHSICKHEKISIGIWKGNTHKKDFYEDVCNNCGKIINEYSI